MRHADIAPVLLLLALVQLPGLSQQPSYSRLRVQQPTSIDWTFPILRHSASTTRDDLVLESGAKGYEYDFYGPTHRISRSLPLILYISPQNTPLEWAHFGLVCQKHGVMFAAVHDAGNRNPCHTRIRTAIEVLGDVRRRHRVDPDRTYASGFSGGAYIASRVAFALPEYFGGLINIGSAVQLPQERWLEDRVRLRHSVALLVGGNELIGPYVEYVQQSSFVAKGIPSRVFVSRGGGHRMPKPTQIENAFLWVDQHVARRRALADSYPASRTSSGTSAEDWRALLLSEAQERLADENYRMAIALLEGIEARWPETDEASVARRLLAELRARDERPWDEEHAKEETEVRIATAQGMARIAHDRRPSMSKSTRASHAQAAIDSLRQFDETQVTGLDDSIKDLEKIIAAAGPAPLISLSRHRYALVDTMTRREALRRFKATLERLDYQVTVPEDLDIPDKLLDETLKYNYKSVDFDRLRNVVLKPLDLRLRRKGDQIAFEPVETESKPAADN